MSFRYSKAPGDNRGVAADPEQLVSAAFRLKHDLGKAVRWNAPARRERSVESLRRRLARDLVETRTGPDGRTRSAVEVFDAWMAGDGALFHADPDSSDRIARMAASVEEIRRLVPRLAELGRDDLVALDEASLDLAEETRALWRERVAAAPAASLP
jgi:hypothetical protein